MCGIAGVFTAGPRALPDLHRTVEVMTTAIEHRGPDDLGSWFDPEAGLGLGFRRLAILDLSPAGHQPMASPGGRWVCIFNGEVYNHLELRGELERQGVSFRGHSDTETIVAAVELWGIEAAVRRFVGMFAIALWDREEKALHLVRDRLGIKPVFVHAEPGRIAFASEMKALMTVPGLDRSVDREALLAYLRRLHVPGPLSIFNRVRKLTPGSILTIRSPEAPLPEPAVYWSVEEKALEGLAHPLPDEASTLDELDGIVSLAVRQRMLADVPLGAFLSGGIDSSLVVALMQEASDRPVRTFSIGFDDPEHDEAPYAAAVARHLGTDHHQEVLTAADARDLVPRLPELFDEPFASSSAIPNMLVCAAARPHVTVALSGVGGDEIFGGYNRYTRLERVARLVHVPSVARRALSRILTGVGSDPWERLGRMQGGGRPPGGLRRAGDGARKLALLLNRDSAPEVYTSLVSAWQDPTRFVPGARMPLMRDERILAEEGAVPSLLLRAMLSDQMGYLTDDQLVVADRTSMAVGLEVRVPLLDHRVVECSWRLPRDLKVRGSVGKWALRRLLARRVPEALFERPKVGFSVPLEAWLRGPLREWAGDLLGEDRIAAQGLLAPAEVTAAWNRFQRGWGEGALGIWTLVMFQAWMDRWTA